jgi:hypothetical protein
MINSDNDSQIMWSQYLLMHISTHENNNIDWFIWECFLINVKKYKNVEIFVDSTEDIIKKANPDLMNIIVFA